jgi:hypothetical protein
LGFRVTANGRVLAVAGSVDGALPEFRVADGSFLWFAAGKFRDAQDLEECGGGGWLVACERSMSLEFVGSDMFGGVDGEASLALPDAPLALALVPGLGVVVRGSNALLSGHVRVLTTPSLLAIASMSVPRVAWLVGVARGVLRAALAETPPEPPCCERGDDTADDGVMAATTGVRAAVT